MIAIQLIFYCFTIKQKFSHIEFRDFLNKTLVSSRDHGTICSAVAVGSPHVTLSGVTIPRGVAPGAKLVVYRIADKGKCDINAILNALQHIKQNVLTGGTKVDVISISYDLDGKDEEVIHGKIDELTDMGIIFVAAAGNRGLYQTRACIPARFDNVISVGALDGHGELAPYTPRVEIDVYAPGIFSADNKVTSFLANYKGTSFAAPAVAGLVLLLKQWANFIGLPAKENIDILRKIFCEKMFVKSDNTEHLIDKSQPTVKEDNDGHILVFQPVNFFMNMKDQLEQLNVIVQEH